MGLIVQKYGGTSVGNLDRIRDVAIRIKASYDEGHNIVVVVSARGGVTNELIAKAKSLHAFPDEREMDMLLAVGEQETIALTAIALHALGIPAVSQTGAQAGILTDYAHTRARIKSMHCEKIKEYLHQKKVVIVAGFQGITPTGEITTLGRGGSDLTAIALAHGLKADVCQIFTDVEGVYTADPRIIPQARKIQEISHAELLELSSMGSKVMQARAVEFAQRYNVDFEVRSSFNHSPGTQVKKRVLNLKEITVTGVAVDNNQTLFTITHLPNKPGITGILFQALNEHDITIDMAPNDLGHDGVSKISFSVNTEDRDRTKRIVDTALLQIGQGILTEICPIAKVSLIGRGIHLHAERVEGFFNVLANNKIDIALISTSELKISAAIDPSKANEAASLLHQAFNFENEPLLVNNV